MADLPYPWGDYVRLQEQLARRVQVDDLAWGLEAGLNRLLESPATPNVERAVQSASRKERYRARLFSANLTLEESNRVDPDNTFDARELLDDLQTRVSPTEWSLLRAVGDGYEYDELAAAEQATPGALRARVLRLRRRLRPFAEETLSRLSA
jgi:DNA-directed RNA polymerase specialized sigma24 family protein